MDLKMDSFWQKSRLVVKAGFIGVLTLLLLIPMAFISGLVSDRQQRHDKAYRDISGKWAASQTITGPVLMVPYHAHFTEADGRAVTETRKAYFLPDSLEVTGKVAPEKRYRGIYEATLYRSDLLLGGRFRFLNGNGLKIAPEDWIPGSATLLLGLDDLRGVENRLTADWNGTETAFEPGLPPNSVTEAGLSAPVTLDTGVLENGTLPFSIHLRLKGSGDLGFVPAGKGTHVHIESPWRAPSFTGGFLPDTRQIGPGGFSADWKVFHLNRNFPQQWTDGKYDFQAAAFGVSLMEPVDFYQKTMRCVKYAILIIALTFTVFFLVETGTRNPVHPFQYLLIGLALCVFYTLLISISEYLYFAWAYGIASLATTGLITLYATWLFRDRKMPLVTGCSLALLYGYIFVLIQLEDFALLAGSVGLFIVLAVLMYFSRRIHREDPAAAGA